MDKITIKDVTKVFGNHPDRALTLIKQGVKNDQIRKQTRQVVGIRNINLAVQPGESFVLMGLSGSGKSTLLRCINFLISPTSGTIMIDGQDLTRVSSQEMIHIRRKKMSMVFQRFALLPNRTVVENVAYGLEVDNVPKAERLEKARKALELVGLGGWAEYYPNNLSGGMQQRVGLARALATDPDILLMDEPFSALDPLIRQDMQDELIELQKKLQKTIIFVTHDLDEALKIGDRIALMKDGEIVQIGTAEEILLSPATDYVARFVENVDRSKALTAATVMVKPRSVAYTKDGPRTALHLMEKHGMSSVFVTDRERRLLGYVVAEDALDAASRGEKSLDGILKKDMPVTSPDTYLNELLDTMASSRVPLAVVDEDNSLKGILVRGSVIAGIAGERRE
ncbi:MAG: quaternary amine ABC transporter ATP-binding protein [Syntrophomonadales bacterium]|jgi:glycine betaine/proline transport system ATP-binding protein